MMKVLKVLLAVCLCALLLSGCGDKETADTVPKSNRPETQADMTGFPSGTVQRECLYVDGTLYLYNGKWSGDLQQAGYTYYVKVAREDVYRIPDTDLTAAWVDVGCKVYVGTAACDSILVETGGTLYRYTAGTL